MNTTPQGEIITMYMVNVQYSTHASYSSAKRYSDFATLHSILKDVLSSNYKFPNKSWFHNNAQFTKERRIRGFDELLKLLAKHQPFDPNFQAFLEIKQNISPSDREAMIEQMKTQTLDHRGNAHTGSTLRGPSRRAMRKSVSLKSVERILTDKVMLSFIKGWRIDFPKFYTSCRTLMYGRILPYY